MRLALLLLVACSGSAKQTPVVEPAPVAKPEPSCALTTETELPDGKFRCRELPVIADFPTSTKLKREDVSNMVFFSAQLERGALGVLLEPAFEPLDEAALRSRVEALIRGIASDAVLVDVPAPKQDGATVSLGISFTTPDGGAGLVLAYNAHNWLIAGVAGGRKPDTETRPDKPIGKAFLDSLKLRVPPSGWEQRTVFDTVKLELPLAAFEEPPEGKTTERGMKLYAVSTERMWIGIRDLEPSPKCELFGTFTDDDVPNLIRKMFGKEDLSVPQGKILKIGTKGLYAVLETQAGAMAMYLICEDPRVMLVTVTGKRTPAELTTMLDRVTKAFAR